MGEIVIGIFLILLSALIYFNSGDFAQLNAAETHLDPGSYPKLIAALLFLLSLILIVKQMVTLIKAKEFGFKNSFKDFLQRQWHEYRLVFYMLAVLGLYIFTINLLGFIVSTILFIIAAGLLIGPIKKKNVITIAIISFAMTFAVYFFFENVLYVRFPNGIFF
ncbi:tripartite tricarboxylate transporter TctB family protein [Virgibacillus kimchii]